MAKKAHKKLAYENLYVRLEHVEGEKGLKTAKDFAEMLRRVASMVEADPNWEGTLRVEGVSCGVAAWRTED